MSETTAAESPTSGDLRLFDDDTEVTAYERSPLDVLRVLLFTIIALAIVALTKYLREGWDGIEENLTELLDVPWTWARIAVDGALITAVTVAGLALLVIPLVTRRLRLFGYIVAANLVSAGVIAGIAAWVGLNDAEVSVSRSADEIARGVSVDVAGATQLVAACVAVSPFVSRRWRRAGAWLVGSVLIMRLLVATSQTTHALLVLTVGGAVGSLVLLAFGRPTTRPRLESIVAVLRATGLRVAEMHPASVDARGSVPYFATLEDGSGLFVKVLGTDQRAADLLFRLYRAVRLRNVGDERPFSSLRRTVEHEALVALQARDVGVRTPRMRGVAPVGHDSFLLAYDILAGKSLNEVDPSRVTDDVLTQLWEQVALLREYRIAHRDLRLANVFLAEDEVPWIIDFGFSEVAASDTLLRADVAQLIASMSVEVGAARAVGAAVDVLGPDAVAESLGRLQPAALSGATQTQLKQQKGLLDDVRTEIQQRCHVEEPELEPVTRFGGRQIFTLVMLAAVFYFLIPQFADLPGIFGEVKDANWAWLVPILLASAVTYVGATIALFGSVPSRLPIGPSAAAQVGSSFASKVAPAGLGGMALNVRFLQKQGVDSVVATSAVGLNAGAGFLGHLALIGVFLVWAGNSAFGDVKLPSPRAFAIGVAVVVVVAGLAMAVPATRHLVTKKLFPILAKSLAGLKSVLTSPGKIVLLLGGSTLVTFSYIIAFVFSCRAFELDQRFSAIGAVYLVGAAIATAAPTPGGLGATEAALIGGLIAIGVDKEQAVPAVFLFRLATFWLPILPGWIAFTWLRRTDAL